MNRIEFINHPDPSRILSALAEVWQIHLEAETGLLVRVTVKEEDDGCPD
jgi:hypothetical protein